MDERYTRTDAPLPQARQANRRLRPQTQIRSVQQTRGFAPATLNRLALGYTLLLCATLFWLFRRHGFDDPYITYRYAANLARGYGFVYNQGEHVLSTTTPLYALLLAPFHLAGLDVPLVSNAIGCVSLAFGGWALWQLGRESQAPLAGAVALVLYPTSPLLIPALGAETALYILTVLLAALTYVRGGYVATAVLLAVATLLRADGALPGAVFAAHYLLARRGPIPWRALATFVVIVAPWFLFALLYFGAPVPVTLFVKRQQARLPISQTFLQGFVPTIRSYHAGLLFRLQFPMAIAGLGYALLYRRRWCLVPGWSLLYFVAYSMLGVSRYLWYYAPLVPGFVALVGTGVVAAHGLIERLAGHRFAAMITLLLAAGLAFPPIRTLGWMSEHPDRRLAIYQTAGRWLAENTPPDASIGILETGIVGYYTDRRMIDFAGLLQPETAAQLSAATSYEDAALWATARFRPDYLVLSEGTFPRLEQDPGVQAGCRNVKSFADPALGSRLVVYECKR